MKLEDAKLEFIETWSAVGTHWGISRAMAQIHALLLLAPEPLNTDTIIDYLHISRGSASMSIRALVDWGLIEKKIKRGERVEYFAAEKDIWKIATRILKERRKRELEPLKKYLSGLNPIENDKPDEAEFKEFQNTIKELTSFVGTADKALAMLGTIDKSWFFSSLLKLAKTK